MWTLSLIACNENNKKILIIKAVPIFLWWAKALSVGFELALTEGDIVNNLFVRTSVLR